MLFISTFTLHANLLHVYKHIPIYIYMYTRFYLIRLILVIRHLLFCTFVECIEKDRTFFLSIEEHNICMYVYIVM